ncbi:hypothetical protein JTB14_024817 [Gonioctena quinquepunctata]|nr:hypothetical protein JTB14_024817 [Gonioctena quinquepunctata]
MEKLDQVTETIIALVLTGLRSNLEELGIQLAAYSCCSRGGFICKNKTGCPVKWNEIEDVDNDDVAVNNNEDSYGDTITREHGNDDNDNQYRGRIK